MQNLPISDEFLIIVLVNASDTKRLSDNHELPKQHCTSCINSINIFLNIQKNTLSDSRKMRLLLIEDESELASLMAHNLRRDGFAIDVASSIKEANDFISVQTFDAIILDLNLPDGDGFTFLDELRGAAILIPLLIVSASGELESRLRGLYGGADDYIVKPFSHEELVARLRTVLRRPGGPLAKELTFGNLVFNTISREVFIDEAAVILTKRELSLLETLVRRGGHVVTREIIQDSIYDFSSEFDSNVLDVIASRLRKKLIDNNATVSIHAIRGVGYILRLSSSE